MRLRRIKKFKMGGRSIERPYFRCVVVVNIALIASFGASGEALGRRKRCRGLIN